MELIRDVALKVEETKVLRVEIWFRRFRTMITFMVGIDERITNLAEDLMTNVRCQGSRMGVVLLTVLAFPGFVADVVKVACVTLFRDEFTMTLVTLDGRTENLIIMFIFSIAAKTTC